MSGRKKKQVVPKEKKQSFRFADFDPQITPDGSLQLSTEDREKLMDEIKKRYGTRDEDTLNLFFNQIVNLVSPNEKDPFKRLGQITPILRAINPADELEAMVALQLTGMHCLSMEMMSRAVNPEQTVEGVNYNVNRATKLSRTFIALLESLNKHRGKGQQKMTVEHIHVNEGGQAIVGKVERGGG
ncbi:MAG: hypothetical protein U9R57_03220 [Thermodesulfobacteriota bacterium]|nr:hypothetical protein [Thermodesulfobacteriota bacterium]